MQSGRVATLNLRITDLSGQPLSGANVSFKGAHASMTHGAGTVVTQEREPGVYTAGFMPTMSGPHSVTVTVDSPNAKGEKIIDAQVQ